MSISWVELSYGFMEVQATFPRMAKPDLPSLRPPRYSSGPLRSMLLLYVREEKTCEYDPNKSICAGWGDSIFRTDATGAAICEACLPGLLQATIMATNKASRG
jgi:hypothetical protein